MESDHFATLPMHGCALGVEENLIHQMPRLVTRRKRKEDESWSDLTNSIQKTLGALKKISIDWCICMTSSETNVLLTKTSNWLSDHYLTFTRLSLVHFAPFDNMIDLLPSKNENDNMCNVAKAHMLKASNGVCVLWFCLISHMLADEKVSSTIVDNYVKLFLSSCAQLDYKIREEVPSDLDTKTERKTNASKVKKSKVSKKSQCFSLYLFPLFPFHNSHPRHSPSLVKIFHHPHFYLDAQKT